jgi:hypothetical protein
LRGFGFKPAGLAVFRDELRKAYFGTLGQKALLFLVGTMNLSMASTRCTDWSSPSGCRPASSSEGAITIHSRSAAVPGSKLLFLP